MNVSKSLLVLGLLTLGLAACRQDEPAVAEAATQTAETIDAPVGYYSIDIPVVSPDIIDLETGTELRALPSVRTNASGFPVIKLPATINNLTGQQCVTLRWRPVNPSNLNTLYTVQGITPKNGVDKGNTGYDQPGAAIDASVVVETYGDRQALRIFLPYGNKGGWFGSSTDGLDLYVYLTYGVQVAGPTLHTTYHYERLKHYYGSGLIYPDGSDVNRRVHYFGYQDASVKPSNNTDPRKLYLATESAAHEQMIFPMMTVPAKGVRKTKADHPQGTTMNNANQYNYLTIPDVELKARGTIMGLNFKNEVGQSITIRSVEVKNDAFAYDGYFGAGALAYNNALDGTGFPDGYDNSAIMTNQELVAGTALKFVETNKRGFSQKTLTSRGHTAADYMPTSQLFELYNGATRGITAGVGAVTDGRFFLWGYPKNGGTRSWTVRVKYVRSGETNELTSAPQRVNPPSGGFREGTAYLTTIRVKP